MIARRRLLSGAASVAIGTAWRGKLTASTTDSTGPGTSQWLHADPESVGLSAPALELAASELTARADRQGLVVVRHGHLVFERYWASDFARAVPEWQNVSFSAGKSWGATMVGRAVSQGKLVVDDLASRYRDPEVSGLHPATTIRHLLTMTSGGTLNMKPSSVRPKRLDDTTPPGPGADYQWHDKPEEGTPAGYGTTMLPGTAFYYDGAPADHLADIVAAAVGRSSHRYMLDEVAGPLGCHFGYQPEGIDSNDNVRIGGSILISCRDLARLGQLYLNGGRWGGAQLIDETFIREAVSSSELNPGYGFLWWLNYDGRVAGAPRDMYFAAGALGQFCFVLPELDMVISTMGFGRNALSTEEAWEAFGALLPTARQGV